MDANISSAIEHTGMHASLWTIKDLFDFLHQTPVPEIEGHFPASFNQQV